MTTGYDPQKLVGKWKLECSEHFEEFLKALGVNMATRKVACMQKNKIIITHAELKSGQALTDEAVEWTLETSSTIKCNKQKFHLKQAFKCKTLYGQEVDDLFELDEENKLKETHTAEGELLATIYRYVDENDEMITISDCKGVTCTRKYKRAHE
ncbi:hypothetical protein ACOME3_003048 [Neoechinorhynchus agilis]